MDYIQIERFLMIAKHLNLSEAAKELYISQPALSLSLANMEKRLGIQLFYRVRNGLVLTPDGEELRASFEQIKEAYDQLYEKKERLQEREECTVRLGCMGNALLYASMFMSDLLKPEGITVKTICADRDTTIEMLRNGQLDFAITSPPLTECAVGNINLYRENIVIVTSKGHRLSEKKGLALKDIKEERLYALSKEHYFRELCDKLCNAKGFEVKYQGEQNMLDFYDTVEQHRYGDGFVAFCAEDSFQTLYGEGYVSHPILDVDFTQTTVLSFIAERKLQFRYEEFVNHIVKFYPLQRKLYEQIYGYIVESHMKEEKRN